MIPAEVIRSEIFPNSTRKQQTTFRLGIASLATSFVLQWLQTTDDNSVKTAFRMTGMALLAGFGASYAYSKPRRIQQLRLVMKAITEKNIVVLSRIPNWQNMRTWGTGITLLCLALMKKNIEYVNFLLAFKVDPNLANRNGLTPLLQLSKIQDLDFISVVGPKLISAGAGMHACITTYDYETTPLALAFDKSNEAFIKFVREFSFVEHRDVQQRNLFALNHSAQEWRREEREIFNEYELGSQAWNFTDDKIEILTPSQKHSLWPKLYNLLFFACSDGEMAKIERAISSMIQKNYEDPYRQGVNSAWMDTALAILHAIVIHVSTLSDAERMIYGESLKAALSNCTHATMAELTILYYQTINDGGKKSREFSTREAAIVRSLTKMRHGIKDDSIKIHIFRDDWGGINEDSCHSYVHFSKIMNFAIFHLPEGPFAKNDTSYKGFELRSKEAVICQEFYSRYNVWAVAKWVQTNNSSDFSQWLETQAKLGWEIFEEDTQIPKFSLFIDFLVEMKVIRKKECLAMVPAFSRAFNP